MFNINIKTTFVVKIILTPKLLTMKNGTVKFFNESKGFGFIIEEGSNNEYFVHVSGLIDKINEGDAVEFELTEGKKGLNAINVKVI